jgi:hypothetical protein
VLLSLRFRVVAVRFAAGMALSWVGVTHGSRAATVSVAIDPDQGRVPISPYIYGTNQDLPGITAFARRQGGNRMTGYNWENNASNAGSDWNQSSDDYMTSALGIPSSQANVPAKTITFFHDQSLAAGTPYSLVTLQMAGYVAADKNGTVSSAEAAPSARWVAVKTTKPSAFVSSPDLNDGSVYLDELLNLLVQRYGPASSATGIKGYDLDNEPDLWSSTHPRLHPTQPTCAELVAKSVDLAKAVKRVDPSADTLGFVSYGFNGYYNFQNATDWATERTKGNYGWFIDYYLDQLRQASTTAGVRLLDVLDLHNYSEAQGGGARVTDSTDYTNTACNRARIQAPRAFWDPTYVENSWIGQYYASYMPFLPKIQASVATFYPGTKLAFSEYNFGGEGHISGGLAQADILGVFGQRGVYLATLWPLHSDLSYSAAAFKLYLNYDGAGGKFGSTAVSTTASDPVNASAYAAIEGSSANRLHVVALNKSDTATTTVTFHIAGATSYTSARVFAFDATSAALTERTAGTAIAGNTFSYDLPPLTAAHFVLTAATATMPTIVLQPAAVSVDRGANVVLSVLATGAQSYQWQKDGTDVAGATSASLALPNVSAASAGSYRVRVNAAGGAFVLSDAAVVSVGSSAYVAPASQLINLSTRAKVGTGSNLMIAGFVVGGSGSKRLLIRAVGPTLSVLFPSALPAGVVLAQPSLQLTTLSGTPLAANSGWADDPQLAAAAQAASAFGLASGSADAALIVTLPPGAYSALVTGTGGATGIALVEVYDLDPTSAARLINLSSRVQVRTGVEAAIAGFVIAGASPHRMLVRVDGPALTAFDPVNLSAAVVLPDPTLDLKTQAGVSLGTNDNWDASDGAAIAAAAQAVGAFGLGSGAKDAAVLATLAPGAYTPVASDKTGASGLALFEVYEAP